jgi:hypothetical protein
MSELPGIGFSKEVWSASAGMGSSKEVWSASVVSSIVCVCVHFVGETMGIRGI